MTFTLCDARIYIAPLTYDHDDKPLKMGTSKRTFCTECSSMLWNYHDEYPDVSPRCFFRSTLPCLSESKSGYKQDRMGLSIAPLSETLPCLVSSPRLRDRWVVQTAISSSWERFFNYLNDTDKHLTDAKVDLSFRIECRQSESTPSPT